ncbi:pseudouridylate synthase [Weissella koreensis KCTC 3621]|uniref:tRNA pseudouridine(55) synthase TruB n=1 Tax=Weissella koreensis TaxID=165096 RepID=UPI00021753CB|nr:tRNA pseudouridine(55) synthase TruB [Weissella koreensis]AEJ24026.1 tRNA pseudouridine synthase B [Weissella koreensis KACC 15510]EJF34627.1 pseudouridylate synthase [Weissella koreensis KCTC 3621]
MDGIIAVNKPSGMTSHDVVFRLRKILQMKKIGHAGTLDPSVDGVLPVALGRATKTIEFLQNSGKVYTGEIIFGFSTETEDLDGEVVEKKPLSNPFDTATITTAMEQMTGEITQIPPMYSAVKVNGRRLYQYARAGETVERPERQVMIYDFEMTNDPSFDLSAGTQTFTFTARVSKGTYIRTLAVDLGKHLGVPAVMSRLTRVEAGGFKLEQAHSLEEIAAQPVEKIMEIIYPLDYALNELPHVELTHAQWVEVKDGKGLSAEEMPYQSDQLVYVYDGEVKSVVAWNQDKNQYRPYRTFKIH